jgi:hypothetical protein
LAAAAPFASGVTAAGFPAGFTGVGLAGAAFACVFCAGFFACVCFVFAFAAIFAGITVLFAAFDSGGQVKKAARRSRQPLRIAAGSVDRASLSPN